MHSACQNGHMDIIQYLITEQGDSALPDDDGSMPIHTACYHGKLSVVKYLITEQHCDPNSRGQFGRTPMHSACQNGHMDIIQYMISEQGCDPALPDDDGGMPIHIACLTGKFDVVKYLITEQHCDPNSRGELGCTPMYCACQCGNFDIIQYLISEQGCDPELPINNGHMPIHMTCYSGQVSVVKYLITEQHCDRNSRGFQGDTPLHIACQLGHMEIIQYLITELGCDPGLPNDFGMSPILIATFFGQSSVVKYLFAKQYSDSNRSGRFDFLLLHRACMNGDMDELRYLITELDYDPKMPNNVGNRPIHIACLSGQFNVVMYLITEQHCDPNVRGRYGRTPLHYACMSGNMDIIYYLIRELGCDPAIPDSSGNRPIHIACLSGHLILVKYLIIEHKNCDPNSRGQFGNMPMHFACQSGQIDVIDYLTELGFDSVLTNFLGNMPIHIACQSGQLNVVKYLITKLGCDSTLPNIFGDKPIHIACLNGQLSVVRYLIMEQHCDPNSRGEFSNTPLHIACLIDHMDLIYLVTELGCDPTLPNIHDDAPIHIACLDGNLNLVKYFFTKKQCNSNSRGRNGTTPLHCACKRGHMKIIQYLITELGCDPVVVDKTNISPLHLACRYGNTLAVKYLLQDGRVNVSSEDIYGRTPVDCAELSNKSYELLKLFHPLLKSRADYPIHSFTKAVLTGNSGAGKSSLAKIIIKQAPMKIIVKKDKDTGEGEKSTVNHSIVGSPLVQNENEFEVEALTAGIDSYEIRSEKIGNIVLYDLAGQSEYYFSQSVIMETVMQSTPAIFINLVDLSKSEEEIAQAVHYWLTFIENITSKASNQSCIIMVGSHIDLLNENELLIKSTLVQDLIDRRVKHFNYEGFVGMDCRKLSDTNTERFLPLLSQCQTAISTYSPPVSVYCHMLYSFLQTKLDKIACRFEDLISYFSTEEELVIPPNESLLSDLLEYLGDKGLIIYLKNNDCQAKSWVVVKREVIMKDINGVLFKPKYFRGYRPVASSTGIIRVSSLSKLFHEYDPEMLVQLMIRLEFCCPVNLSDIKTNLTTIDGTGITDINLFFPCLLSVERPQALTSEIRQSSSQQVCFGWCLGCMDYEYQFLTSRFIHILLLRLAYTFPLPSKGYSKIHNLYGLEKRCTVWKNGISWNNINGIRTVVEVIQQSRWVVVTMYHNKDITRPVEYSKHRSAVIRLVLELQKELAPDLETLECLISPSLLQQCPLDRLHESDLFTIADVASSILCCNPSVLSYKYGSNSLSTEKAICFEPYHLLSPSTVYELMDSSKSDQPVSSALLNEVRECCQQPQLESQSRLSLRKHLDSMSIFTGRNPLVSIMK